MITAKPLLLFFRSASAGTGCLAFIVVSMGNQTGNLTGNQAAGWLELLAGLFLAIQVSALILAGALFLDMTQNRHQDKSVCATVFRIFPSVCLWMVTAFGLNLGCARLMWKAHHAWLTLGAPSIPHF